MGSSEFSREWVEVLDCVVSVCAIFSFSEGSTDWDSCAFLIFFFLSPLHWQGRHLLLDIEGPWPIFFMKDQSGCW